MDLGSTVVADEEPLEVVQPGDGALDDPADAAEPGAMFGRAAGDHGLDAARSDEPSVLFVVVAAIGDERVGSKAGPADHTAHGRRLVDQRDQLGDVVAVATRQRPGERDPARVYE